MTKRTTSLIDRLLGRVLNSPSKNGELADLGYLTNLVRRYSVEQQQVPKDLQDLVALKYLDAVPPAPAGQRFVVDRRAVEVRLE